MNPTQEYTPGISIIAALLADPGRGVMIWALMDGTARPAGELALMAGLTPSAASGHLARLTDGGLLTMEVRGRHRYYRIANPAIATAVEALANAAQTRVPARVRPLPEARKPPIALRQARTCYDHMAGEAAVALFDRMVAARWLQPAGNAPDLFDITSDGTDGFGAMGIVVADELRRKRRFCCACLDWSERKPHMGGALGAALLRTFLERGWVERIGESRALRITPSGHNALGRIAA